MSDKLRKLCDTVVVNPACLDLPCFVHACSSGGPDYCIHDDDTNEACAERLYAITRADVVREFVEEVVTLPCPWPVKVWPMTDAQYVEAVPDELLRTAISGYLMRAGWETAMQSIEVLAEIEAAERGEQCTSNTL